jgi:hypothetical protein
VPIPEDEIESITCAARSGLPIEPCVVFQPGYRVEVIDGPLRGVRGVVSGNKGEDQLIIMVDLLQRGIAVRVDRKWITAPDGRNWQEQQTLRISASTARPKEKSNGTAGRHSNL